MSGSRANTRAAGVTPVEPNATTRDDAPPDDTPPQVGEQGGATAATTEKTENAAIPSAVPPAPSVMTPAQRLGMRLRQARLRHNMTQSEVAQKQFSVSYISAVERGQIRPSLGALERLSERLEVPLADLLQDRDQVSFGLAERGRESSYGSYGDRQREEVETRLRDGMVLLYHGKPADAITTLQSLTGRTLSLHDQVMLRWRLAQCSLALERGEDARRESQEGLMLAERAGDVELREHLRATLGEALVNLRKFQLALDQFRACEEAVQQRLIREPVFHLNVLYDLGNTYWAMSDADTAIRYLRQATELAADVTRPQRLGRLYQQLSADYARQQDATRARYYAQRSLAAFEEAEHLRLTGHIYNRLGQAQAHNGQTGEALDDLRAALELADDQQDSKGVIEAQRSLAAIYVSQQKIDDAARAIAVAQTRSTELHDPIQQGDTLLVLAQIQEARKEVADAEKSYDEAIRLFTDVDATQHQSDAYAQFSSFLERRGQIRKALEYLKTASRLREGAPVS